MSKSMHCPRCLRGMILVFGGEPTCVNCGWGPPSDVAKDVLEEVRRRSELHR